MPIVSHSTEADTNTQGGTRRYIRHIFTDHLGNNHVYGFMLVSASWTETEFLPWRLILVGLLESSLDDGEGNELIELAALGEDILARVLSPKHSTSKALSKKLIRYMMRERDPRIVIALEPLIVYLRANFTVAQLRNFLDLTTAQLQKMNQRVNAILDNKAAVFDVFDGNAEEIE